jgi:predicted transcriptional regulator
MPYKEISMDDHLKLAIELATAQASVRVMQEEEMVNMIRSLSTSLKKMSDSDMGEDDEESLTANPSRSIKGKTITCLECGKVFKLITSKHLAQHGLDADSYRRKWGLKVDVPLVCKSLQRTRRKKMKDMKLWEKRRAAV